MFALAKIKESIISFSSKHIFVLLLLLITIVIHHQWFFSQGAIFADDWKNWPDENVSRFVNGGYGSYIDDVDLGSQNVQIYLNFLFFLWGLIKHYALAERLTLLIPIAILSVISPYFLVKEITNSKLTAFCSALVFSSFTVVMKLELAHLFIAFTFMLSPLILLYFIKLLNYFSAQNTILFVLFYSLGTFYEARIMIVVSFVLLIYLVMSFHARVIPRLFVAGLAIMLLNAFWLLPTIFSDKQAISSIINRGLFGEKFFNILYSFTNYFYSWNGGNMISFVNQPIPFYFWIVPIFSFGILLFTYRIDNLKDRKLILFFGIISLIGIILTKQSAPPFNGLYRWLYYNLPGFNIFREPSKFYLISCIGYLGLFAFSLKYIVLSNNRISNIVKGMVISLFLVIPICASMPFITGDAGWLFASKVQPSEYGVLNESISKQRDYFRTYWIPRDSQWGFYNFDKPKISSVSVADNQYKDYYEKWLQTKNYADFILSPFEQNYGKILADISSIKYFILPMQDDQDNVFFYYGSRYQEYLKKIRSINFLSEVDVPGLGGIKVFENKNYKPPIFSFTNLYSLSESGNFNSYYDFITNKLDGQFYFAKLVKGNNRDPLTDAINPFVNLNKGVGFDGDRLIANFSANDKKYYNFYNVNNAYGKISLNNLEITENFKDNLSMSSSENVATYQSPAYSFTNLIDNPSFELGKWQTEVGDCNNYDTNPILAISLDTADKSDGNQSLQIEATRHSACTFISTPVFSGGHYLLSFDYQSPNNSHAAYYVGFDDANKTFLREILPVEDSYWHTFSKDIKVPDGANTLVLYVYTEESDGKTNNINRYDNFRLTEIPNLNNTYYLASIMDDKLEDPKNVRFDLVGPTNKLVHINGATTPFFLAMSESYNPGWRLELNAKNVQGLIDSWWPFVKENSVPSEYHYQLNGFLNVWYIDPLIICADNRDSCIENADGSYDIEMKIEFTPQRWFYFGIFVSLISFFTCLTWFLASLFIKNSRLKI